MMMRHDNGKWTPAFKWAVGLLTALLMTLGGAVVAKSYDNGERVTAVEVQQMNDSDRIQRIESNVDKLVEELL